MKSACLMDWSFFLITHGGVFVAPPCEASGLAGVWEADGHSRG